MRDEPVAWLLTGGFYGGEIGDYDIEHNDAECERLNVAANGTEVRVPLFASRWQPIATAPQDGTEIVVWCDGVQAYVRQARELALHNPCAYHKALHDLFGETENRVIFAVMEDDDCQLGRIVRQVLQAAVVEDATQRVLDDIGDAA